MKISIDNITLVKMFLKGENSFISNRELRLENVRNEIHLLTTQGKLLAKGRFTDQHPYVVVRLASDYWELIHQLTLEASFIPFDINQETVTGATFSKYDRHRVPEGYQIHCQTASSFWKAWWINHRQQQLMDMLLLCKKRWYPVNTMLCDTGTIYVKTWDGEKVLSIADTVVWLDRNTHGQRQRVQIRKHHAMTSGDSAPSPPAAPAQGPRPAIPEALRSVIRSGENKLLIQTSRGAVIVAGQNLTCTLARKMVEKS